LVQVAIDQYIIVSAVVPDLLSRFPQPPFDYFIPVLAAGTQSLLQNLPRGSQDKNGYSLRNLTLQLSRTLDVDVEYQVLSEVFGLKQHITVGAIVIAENFGPFEELAAGEHGFELRAGDEVIVLAVDFEASGSTGRV